VTDKKGAAPGRGATPIELQAKKVTAGSINKIASNLQAAKPPRFVLTLQPLHSGIDTIRSLRWILKRLLRQHGFKCVGLREQREDGDQ
jgi:hypothetical protein